MSRAMVRWTVASALAVGGWAAAGPFDAVAEAAPDTNPFAGTYSGFVPGSGAGRPWEIVIDAKGVVKDHEWGSFGRKGGGGSADVGGGIDILEMSGRVSKTGELSVQCRERLSLGWFGYTYGEFSFRATVNVDGQGNLHGTTTDGTTFDWIRQ